LKAFYLKQNGMQITWKVKVDNTTIIPLGKLRINSLKELTKVGSVLKKDFEEPSIFDLDDLQSVPKFFLKGKGKTKNLDFSSSSSSSSSISSTELPSESTIDFQQFQADSDSETADDDTNNNNNNNSPAYVLVDSSKYPHFDETSKNFEIDNCNGYGKVCLVFRNCKPAVMGSVGRAEFWYLDRSFQWHYLASSFDNYLRLMLAHLGLPQWQMLFTADGLPPFLYQWYYLLAPGRLKVHEASNWKRLDFYHFIESSNTAAASLLTAYSKTSKQQQQQQQQLQQQQPFGNNSKKKIDFQKLFEEKTAKSTVTPAANPSSTDKNLSNTVKSKAKLNAKK
jgi:hypothetical protein